MWMPVMKSGRQPLLNWTCIRHRSRQRPWLSVGTNTFYGFIFFFPGKQMRLIYWHTDSLIYWFDIRFTASRSPRFLAEPRSTVVEPGSFLTLSCRTDPDSATYRWSLNSSVVASTSSSGSSGVKKKPGFELRDGGTVLKIGPFSSQHHHGTYQCLATVPSMGTVMSSEALVEQAGKFGAGMECQWLLIDFWSFFFFYF